MKSIGASLRSTAICIIISGSCGHAMERSGFLQNLMRKAACEKVAEEPTAQPPIKPESVPKEGDEAESSDHVDLQGRVNGLPLSFWFHRHG